VARWAAFIFSGVRPGRDAEPAQQLVE